MGKHRFQTIRLLLKLILLFQIYSYHCFKAEATENNCPASFNDGEVGEEIDLNDQNYDKNTTFTVTQRPKRPARLLPLKLFL